ncbi:phytanoyl-CoA dioxygenase family protein [Aestuariibius sp. 2305UL40-4]|uniref:phytanoyl-CoA dioxygenase family protein n=1 Tax=Aestuariibius violaceus TaxID=3234132 RepID=UPI00346D9CA0
MKRLGEADMVTEALDLRFRSVTNPAPNALSVAQIDHYNRQGFVQPFDVFTAEEMLTVRAYIDDLITAMGEAGSYGINCYQARLAGLYDLCREPRILDLVEDLIGPNIICWATAILSKAPGEARSVPWHQDASFWALSPARTVTIWLAIDDVDEANAAMQFIPGTHDRGAIAVQQTGGEAVFHQETVGAEEMGTPFTNTLRAGQVSLHADMLVHGSGPNTSARRRCGLTLRYCPPEVEITNPDWAVGVEAIQCRGSDPTGRWHLHQRPENDDIRATSSPRALGNN